MVNVKRWVTRSGTFYTAEFLDGDTYVSMSHDRLFKCPFDAILDVLSAVKEFRAAA